MRRGGLLLGFLLLAFVLFVTACSKEKSKEETAASPKVQTIKIGILTDLSGSLSTIGTDIKNAVSIAKDEVNNYFKNNGYDFKVEIYPEDTQVNPSICLQKVQALKAQGVNVAIGPMASSEVKNIKNYVTSNKMIIISPSSTALPSILGFTSPSEKKYIFRFVPNDEFQGKVIAGEVKGLAFEKAIILFREDAWGKGLKEATLANLNKLSVKVIDAVGYPATPEPSDWSPYIQKMENLLKGTLPKNTAVITIGYEELATLLSQIKDDSPLLSYTWFGSDGVVKSERVLQEAKNKAAKVKLYSTIFYSRSPEVQKLKEKYKEKGFGEEPTQYGLCAYDGLWVAGVSYAQMLKETGGKYDADLLAKKIKENVKKYNQGAYGVKPVTGDIVLNEWNDRASGNYGIFQVTQDGWKLAGIWDYKTGQINWK